MGGLRASWRVLRVSVPSGASGALRVRCEAVLLVEPPVVRDVATIITVYSRTQLSKYVSNSGEFIIDLSFVVSLNYSTTVNENTL